MGRRPLPSTVKASFAAGEDPNVRRKVDEIKLVLYEEIKKRLEVLIADGEVGKMELTELLREFRNMEKMTMRSTSITAINIPQPLPEPGEYSKAKKIENRASTIDDRRRIRKAAEDSL